MRKLTMILVVLGIIGLAGPGHADEEKAFSNETSFSLVNTSGNTDSLSVAGNNKMGYQFDEKWLGTWVVGGLYNENDDKKEAERYFTDLRADYSITDRCYLYGHGGWLRDKFAGFDHRIAVGPGVGYRVLLGPAHFLLFEGGLNYSYEEYTAAGEGDEDFFEGRLAGQYEWQFTEKAKFTQGLEYLQNFEDNSAWKFNSETAVIVSITDVFALKVSYSVLYNNDPRPSSLKETDTIFATSLVIGY